MKYDMLTEQAQADLKEATLAQIEQLHYSNVLALERAKALSDEAQIEQFELVLAGLEKEKKAVEAFGS